MLKNATLKKVKIGTNTNRYVLNIKNRNYFLNISTKNLKNYLQLTRNETVGKLISNSFQVQTGGTIYYNFKKFYTPNYLILNEYFAVIG